MRAWSERLLTRIEVLGIGSGLSADAMRGAGSGVRRVAELTVGPGSVHAVVEEQQDRFETWADLAVWDAEQWQRAEQAVARPPSEALRLLTQGQFLPTSTRRWPGRACRCCRGRRRSCPWSAPARPGTRTAAISRRCWARSPTGWTRTHSCSPPGGAGRRTGCCTGCAGFRPGPARGLLGGVRPYPEPEPQAPGRRSALEELGPSGISIRGRALEHWLAPRTPPCATRTRDSSDPRRTDAAATQLNLMRHSCLS
ncbi:hypothetical protein ACFQZC_05240 [Streptacidiphilus monticola]